MEYHLLLLFSSISIYLEEKKKMWCNLVFFFSMGISFRIYSLHYVIVRLQLYNIIKEEYGRDVRTKRVLTSFIRSKRFKRRLCGRRIVVVTEDDFGVFVDRFLSFIHKVIKRTLNTLLYEHISNSINFFQDRCISNLMLN